MKEGGNQPKAGEQGRHLEKEMRLCCMRECARIPGETHTRCPTVPVRVEPKGEEEPQHAKVSPDEKEEVDGNIDGPGYSTVSGAHEIPTGSIKIIRCSPNPQGGRTE